MSCGVGHRCGSDLVLVWLRLWRRPAAIVLIRPLAWEPPCAVGAALKTQKAKKKNGKKKNYRTFMIFPQNQFFSFTGQVTSLSV